MRGAPREARRNRPAERPLGRRLDRKSKRRSSTAAPERDELGRRDFSAAGRTGTRIGSGKARMLKGSRGLKGIPGPPPPPAAAAAAAGKRYHVRRAVLAQDGHSSGEEMLYQSLWNSRYTRQESKETRLVTIGWKAMAKLARLTPRNTRRNCQSLIDKLAVEQLSEENSRESIGRTYRLFSYKAILERRRAAGLEWVTRSRGVVFVPAPVKATPPVPGREMPSKASAGDAGTTRPGVDIAPDAKRVPGAERDTGSKARPTQLFEHCGNISLTWMTRRCGRWSRHVAKRRRMPHPKRSTISSESKRISCRGWAQ